MNHHKIHFRVNIMNFNLIPFGLNTDGKLVDVHDVPNGKNCGCVCPSCHTPLNARQGDIKEWHFAHLSNKDSIKNTDQICEYSFYVSVRLMAMQLIQDELSLTLPPLNSMVVSEPIPECGCINVSEEFTVVSSQQIELENIELFASESGSKFDISGTVKGYPFYIILNYPGRNISLELSQLQNGKCGILCITLDQIQKLFLDSRNKHISYQELLYSFLQTDTNSKKWLYHPRYSLEKEKAKQRLIEKKNAFIKKCHQHPEKYAPSVETAMANYKSIKKEKSEILHFYQCLNCHHQWKEAESGTRICPKCHNHLYSQRME